MFFFIKKNFSSLFPYTHEVFDRSSGGKKTQIQWFSVRRFREDKEEETVKFTSSRSESWKNRAFIFERKKSAMCFGRSESVNCILFWSGQFYLLVSSIYFSENVRVFGEPQSMKHKCTASTSWVFLPKVFAFLKNRRYPYNFLFCPEINTVNCCLVNVHWTSIY